MSGFSRFVEEDSSSELEVVVGRPGISLGVLEDSRFNDFTRGMDRGLDDWFESVHSEDDWRSFEAYLESNGFEVSDWTFSFSYEDGFYDLTVSPGIDYSSEVPVSNCFRPELDVHVEEVYGVEGASYDRVFSWKRITRVSPNQSLENCLRSWEVTRTRLLLKALKQRFTRIFG